ncbi:GlxA family transcriptional regulator [Streptacidiphilus rugosus]|uniref:GlxA family transcriptional regulator n=1 Tax=Streptacidiphilus rugosus TaxID=405783 RepID=UPI00056B92F2|nr:helix-turn-helix domain-containing protein [Streptacidiphilus rugosus]
MGTVGLIIFDAVRTFDYAVVNEVWGRHQTLPQSPLAELIVCAPSKRPVRLGSGLLHRPEHGLDALARCDLVIVPGLEDHTMQAPDPVLHALQRVYERGTPVASLCAGAFVLASAGLLDGRIATTHWAFADDLAQRHPAVTVDPNVLFTGDGQVWTSAGVAAGIDLCLHLIGQSHGDMTATAVARAMVTAPFRAGGQAQFIAAPIPAIRAGDAIARVREEVLATLERPWTVADMAKIVSLTERTFARRFHDSTGTSPARWLLHQRLYSARRLLETSDTPIEEVSRRCGFGTGTSLRQHFQQQFGTSPRQYRRVFRTSR